VLDPDGLIMVEKKSAQPRIASSKNIRMLVKIISSGKQESGEQRTGREEKKEKD